MSYYYINMVTVWFKVEEGSVCQLAKSGWNFVSLEKIKEICLKTLNFVFLIRNYKCCVQVCPDGLNVFNVLEAEKKPFSLPNRQTDKSKINYNLLIHCRCDKDFMTNNLERKKSK